MLTFFSQHPYIIRDLRQSMDKLDMEQCHIASSHSLACSANAAHFSALSKDCLSQLETSSDRDVCKISRKQYKFRNTFSRSFRAISVFNYFLQCYDNQFMASPKTLGNAVYYETSATAPSTNTPTA